MCSCEINLTVSWWLLVHRRSSYAYASSCSSSFAQALLFQVLLPRPPLLLPFIWWQTMEKLEGKQCIGEDRHTLLWSLYWTAREQTFSSPLFFLSRSLNAARINRLSSKSTALSSWKHKTQRKNRLKWKTSLDTAFKRRFALAKYLHTVIIRQN